MLCLGTKTVEDLECALVTARKYIGDIDTLGDAFTLNLQLGGALELELDKTLARELIVKRQQEIVDELRARRDRITASVGECTCECTCGKG